MVSKNTEKSESVKIWEEIKNNPIDMYTLPDQKVSDHIEKLPVDGPELLVKPISSAAVASLQDAVGKEYEVEQTGDYVTIRRARSPIVDNTLKQFKRRRR